MILRCARCFRELPFEPLMEVYREGNEENGAERYPWENPKMQCLLAEEDFRQYLLDVFFRQEDARYYFLSDPDTGELLSALRTEPYDDGTLLEALETAPCFRGRGYAAELVSRVLPLQAGKVYSHIARENLPSRRVHEKCGFVRKLPYARYLDGSVNTRADTWVYEKNPVF